MKLSSVLNLASLFECKTAAMNDPRLQALSAQPSYAAKIRYADSMFRKLKAGSSRIAYEFSPEYVLKLAKNEKGLQQNATESDNFLQQNYKELVANVVDSDPNDVWIISEMASRITPTEFRTMVGVPMETLCNYLKKRMGNGSFDYLKIENEEQLDEHPIISELVDMMANFQMPAGDICRINSWGKVRGRPVLIDYGLTESIYQEFYK